MSRGAKAVKKRKVELDPIYGNAMLSKFINRMMKDGKKTIAQTLMYETLEIIRSKENTDPIALFEKAIENVSPKVEVKARRIGGAAYQVPTEVRGPRRVSLAARWILEAARKRSNSSFKKFSEKLAAELIDVSKNTGEAVRKRDVAHKMAEANRAFSHFRF